jgi:hypothetical protein
MWMGLTRKVRHDILYLVSRRTLLNMAMFVRSQVHVT